MEKNKKFLSLMLISAIFMPSGLRAGDIITSTLLDHVSPVTQFRSGRTQIALVDSVIQIGSIEGRSLLDVQAGFSGNTKPEADEPNSANLIAGGFLKVSSLLWTKFVYPQQWKFLRSVEHGPYINYDFREKKWVGGYQVGLAFTLEPK